MLFLLSLCNNDKIGPVGGKKVEKDPPIEEIPTGLMGKEEEFQQTGLMYEEEELPPTDIINQVMDTYIDDMPNTGLIDEDISQTSYYEKAEDDIDTTWFIDEDELQTGFMGEDE